LEASRDVSVPWGTIDTFPERICALNPVIVAAGGGAATDLFANIWEGKWNCLQQSDKQRK